MASHLSLLLLLCVSTVISPTLAEVLTQNFVIRLKEMEQLIQDQKQVIDSLKSGVYFTVTFTGAHQFLEGEIIKFDTIITNSGDGYVVNDGKFIAPVNGTYQFSGTFYNVSKKIGAYVKKNNGTVVSANNGKDGTASFSVILDLVEGDEVYLERPHWVDDDAEYSYVSSFSGVLLHHDV